MEFQVVEVQCVAAGVTELANPRQLGAGGGGEGLFPLRCVTALAAADCRRLAGVSAAVSECSHPSASYHPHWRLCFEACSSATKFFNVWLMQYSVLKSVTISLCIYYDSFLRISNCRT